MKNYSIREHDAIIDFHLPEAGVLMRFKFGRDIKSCSFEINLETDHGDLIVTDRSFVEYDFNKEIELKPELQYLEIGPGLSEFIPLITKLPPDKKPIIIEPVDYNLLEELLRDVKSYDFGNLFKEKLELLIERCNIFRDNKKVLHVKKTLGRALDEDDWLIGIADIVVDYFGAIAYAHFTERRFFDVVTYEKLLLKGNGKYFHSG